MSPGGQNAPRRSYSRRLRAALPILLSVAACHAPIASTRPAPMSSERAHAQVDAAGVSLDARFQMRGDTLHVAYRVHNTGSGAVIVFDRGDRHAVLTRHQTPGAVGSPFLREDEGGLMTLSHVARTLPKPPPTVPPVPLVRQLDAGASYEDGFAFSGWLADVPHRLRWCLGVAPSDPARLSSPEIAEGLEIWQADFDYAEDQTLLCTPWFDVALGGFTTDA